MDARIAMALFKKKRKLYMDFIENSTQQVIDNFKTVGSVKQPVAVQKQPIKQAVVETNVQKLRRPPKQPTQQLKGKSRDDYDYNVVKTSNYFADTQLPNKQQN